MNRQRDPDSESKASQDLSTSDYDRIDFVKIHCKAPPVSDGTFRPDLRARKTFSIKIGRSLSIETEFIPPELKKILHRKESSFEEELDRSETELRRLRQENEDLLEQIDSYAMDSLMLNDQIADLKNKNLDLGRSSREAEESAAQSELLLKNAIKHKDDEIDTLKEQIA